MIVKMQHAEVMEACQEWLAKHHGLVAEEGSGAPIFRNEEFPRDSTVVPLVSLTFPGVTRLTPYRGDG